MISRANLICQSRWNYLTLNPSISVGREKHLRINSTVHGGFIGIGTLPGYLVSLCHLILKVEMCATSSADQNVSDAVQHHKVCQPYADALPRWVYVLPNFPFENIIEVGEELQKKTHIAAKTCESADAFGVSMSSARNAESLGRLVSQFITISRGEEVSESNRETWCLSFKTSVGKTNWDMFNKNGGKLLYLSMLPCP